MLTNPHREGIHGRHEHVLTVPLNREVNQHDDKVVTYMIQGISKSSTSTIPNSVDHHHHHLLLNIDIGTILSQPHRRRHMVSDTALDNGTTAPGETKKQ
jgi:hypothetical protein